MNRKMIRTAASALCLCVFGIASNAAALASQVPDTPPAPSVTTNQDSLGGSVTITTPTGGSGGSRGGGSGGSGSGGSGGQSDDTPPNKGVGGTITVSAADPRVTPIFTSPTQTNCTMPDGTPGIQIVIAPILGTAFESICVRPTDPLPADTIVIQTITIEEALAATDFPRITAHTTPGPHGGLPGVAYAIHLEGVTAPTIAPSVRGITLHGRAANTGFNVSTDTGSNRGARDPDGRFTAARPGAQGNPVGTLVWQTGGMKQIRVVTTWHLEYWMTFPNGTRIDIGEADTTVTDDTPHPISGLTTQIIATE
jgi:hypothetical protein